MINALSPEWAVGDFTSFGGLAITDRPRELYPYSYGDYLLFNTGEKPTSGAYSDRIRGWNPQKYVEAKEQADAGRGDTFSRVPPEKIEAFLRLYFDKPDLVLVRVVESCNQANGYPCWHFAWR